MFVHPRWVTITTLVCVVAMLLGPGLHPETLPDYLLDERRTDDSLSPPERVP
jgi:hypothetical protein